MKAKILIINLVFVCFLCGCATMRRKGSSQPIIIERARVLDTARSLVGKKEIVFNRKRYNFDCSSLVRAVYIESLGVDLIRAYEIERGDRNVELIYKYCREYGTLYRRKYPHEADLVFFDRTYDADRDGREKDKLTHVGIVEYVDRNGTIMFIHLDSGGIRRGRMNLRHPHTYYNKKTGLMLNSFLKNKKGKKRAKVLTGELFNTFGTIF